MGIVHSETLKQAAWIVAALAALLLWHGEARASCDQDLADQLFFMAPLPDPAPVPCCATAAAFPAASVQKLDGAGNPSSGATSLRALHAGEPSSSPAPRPFLPDPRWRPYCARSSRLLF